MAKINLKNIYKIYPGNVTAVSDFSLEIDDKEFIVLVGPSGCGKSTVLRMIAGLETITKGEIKIGDRVVNDIAPKDRDIAMVFQSYALYPHMSVYKNLAFSLKLKKMEKSEIDTRVREAANILGIENLLDRKPKALSGGQRQRVALGRAMVRNPKVFLLDEPLSNLDAKLRTAMRSEISKLHQKLGTTFVYVTHDQTEAMTMGDRIVVMKDGFVHQVDTPQNLYDNPVNQFVAGFIGSPQMNFMKAQIVRNSNGYIAKIGKYDIKINWDSKKTQNLSAYEGKQVILGIRPEELHDDQSTEDPQNLSYVDAYVELSEPMGSEIYLYVTIEGEKTIAKIPPRSSARVGDTIKLGINTNQIHLFDIETEKAIAVR